MLRRVLDRKDKGSQSSTLYSLTELSAEYVVKWAPPNSTTYAQVQRSLKKLRELAEQESNIRATYEYDISAVHTASRDERICASYLRQAATLAINSDFEPARKFVEKAKSLLPTYSEAYRISAFIESKAGDLFKATEEYETALEYNPRSTITLYSYALFLVKFLEDTDGALGQINTALAVDPKAKPLLSMKALILTRLGHHADAALIYEDLLKGLGTEPKKWRISIRDQSAECYRRWAEQDLRMRDDEAFRNHINRSVEIIEEAFTSDDYDRATIRRFGKTIDEALSHARQSTGYAGEVIKILHRNEPYYRTSSLELINLADFAETFSRDQDIQAAIETLPIRKSAHRDQQPKSELPRINGHVARLLFDKRFGFIRDEQNHDWYFNSKALRHKRHWEQIRSGTSVTFTPGDNSFGPCAVDVLLLADANEP